MPGPYELYLVRHGLAEERGDAWPDDTKRPLTDEGISRMRKAARAPRRVGGSGAHEPARPRATDRGGPGRRARPATVAGQRRLARARRRVRVGHRRSGKTRAH